MLDLSGTLCRLRFGDSARRCPWVLAGLLIGLTVMACGQEAETGITIPATVTGGLMKSDDAYFGYHGAAYPALRLNEHWYAYGALDIYSTPFFYYPEYNGREWSDVHLNQAYVARTWKGERAGWVVKAGKVPTAFGSPGREYDDMQNPLLDQPLSFTSALPLYPTLNVCAGAQALCFNYSPSYYSFAPTTLYGLWGGEVAGWWKHLDGRAQVANSSPMNPQPLTSGDQHAQWSAGGGYTIGPGFRVGVSGFRGRWLNGIDGAAGTGINTWQPPATGVGVDAEWARGRWNMKAEWQRLTFNYPAAFQTAIPTATFAWTETKVILTPRLYVAARLGYQHVNGFATASIFAPNVARYEGAIGFRPDRFQLMKVGYEWNQLGQTSANMDNVFGVQLVTTLPAYSRALR